MSNNIKNKCILNKILVVLLSCLVWIPSQAAKPVWTFVPQTPTDITVASGDSAQVIYTVNNQSIKPKTLLMQPIAGVSQGSPCELAPKGSCTLNLNITGSALQNDVIGGPVLCERGSDLQCYQPSLPNILRIRLIEPPPVMQFTLTPSAGNNGSIAPSSPQVVNAGSSFEFTASPDAGFVVSQWLVNNVVVQNGGASFQLNNIQEDFDVHVTFAQATLSPSTQSLVLSVNDLNTNMALTGNPRTVTITNNGPTDATGVDVSASGLPNNTTQSNNCPATLAASATCEVTITPANTASLDAGNNACTTGTEPVPGIVSVTADNAAQTDIDILVLGYGCIYQDGYVFAVDDSVPANPRIGGKVVALVDQFPRFPDGIVWDADPACTTVPCTQSTGAWDFNFGENLENVLGSSNPNNTGTNGPGNTWLISDVLNGNNGNTNNPPNYAAGVCISYNGGGHSDWYLPALCDMGTGECPVGAQQNIADNLSILIGDVNNNPDTSCSIGSNCLAGIYWSSTEFSINPDISAWGQFFTIGGGAQDPSNKSFADGVRCVRALTI